MNITKIFELLFNIPSIVLEETVEGVKRIGIDIKETLNGKYNEQDTEEEDTSDIPQIPLEPLGE